MTIESVVFACVMVLGCFVMILAVELHDRRIDAQQRKILKEAVRTTGVVKSVERKGVLDARDGYQWRVTVEFEHGGARYSIEDKCIQKPVCLPGERITVYVDCEDPWQSRIQI